MNLAIITSSIVNVSLLVILCIGFTFTYMMEKFPNFAHTSYASIGTMVAFYLVRFQGFNPYFTWPVAAVIGGFTGILLYLGIVQPIKNRSMREITLTFTFYIISQMITSGLAMFSYWLLIETGTPSSGFMLRTFDFRVWGVPGICLMAPIIMVFLVLTLNIFLYYAKYGIAMRATAEDEKLSSSLGVNVDRMHLASWFISGALSALAGAILPMWMGTSVNYSDVLLVSVMAGSVLGGLDSINGAIIGGFLVASSKKILTYYLMGILGPWIGAYEELIPTLILFFILAIEPNGLMALKGKNVSVAGIKESLLRFRKTIWNLLTTE
ncbi:MAG: branched-chain amino acid ABC transporter permease [Candidatus Bathyarchaeota archaeon]|nr:branched-chain amino acid ABC transporter permease [Candidatus Bathyarchaeota archaeon]